MEANFDASCKLKMKEFRERDACGLPLLGSFTIALVEGLEQLERSWCFYATMEFPVIVEKIKSGVKPACDAAVVAIVDGNEKPLVLFEYKPAVDPRKDLLGRQDLMEVLIQGYYFFPAQCGCFQLSAVAVQSLSYTSTSR